MIALTEEANLEPHDYGALRLRRMEFRRASTLCKGPTAGEGVVSALVCLFVLRSPFAHAQSSASEVALLEVRSPSRCFKDEAAAAKAVNREREFR